MGAQRPDLVEALASAAREITNNRDLTSVLTTIVHAAQRSLPGVDHAGISVTHKDGRVETLAVTGPLVTTLDELQYQLGEGPCLEAISEGGPVIIRNALRETRWPRFIPRAVELGLRSQMGLRVYVEDKTVGGLNLYSTRPNAIEPEVQPMADLFAAHAALALGKARHEATLYTAMHSRKVIGQAIGLLMERHGLDEDRAFQYLARVSQHSNHKLRDIAVELVEQANERNRPPRTFPSLVTVPKPVPRRAAVADPPPPSR
jgi:GAF domain-containing protein